MRAEFNSFGIYSVNFSKGSYESELNSYYESVIIHYGMIEYKIFLKKLFQTVSDYSFRCFGASWTSLPWWVQIFLFWRNKKMSIMVSVFLMSSMKSYEHCMIARKLCRIRQHRSSKKSSNLPFFQLTKFDSLPKLMFNRVSCHSP